MNASLGYPLIVMGVSGAGKSAIASALAEKLGVTFVDADDLHSESNKQKMASGQPLTDADRLPWLDRVASTSTTFGAPVVACSALRRSYRERLLSGVPQARFVELVVSRSELERRLAMRSHGFMPATLLESQLATLQPLEPDEPGFRVDADGPIQQVVVQALNQLRSEQRGARSE